VPVDVTFNLTRVDVGGRINARSNFPETAVEFTEFDSGTGTFPFGIATGPDDNIWFTDFVGSRVGRITTAGTVTLFPLVPMVTVGPVWITGGPDGNLWVTGQFGHVVRVTTTGVVTDFPVTAPSSPFGLAAGRDGRLWFTEFANNRVNAITTAGVITPFTVPTADSGPGYITAAADNNLWFTERNASKIAR